MKSITKAMEEGAERGVFAGAVLCVCRGKDILYSNAVGDAAILPEKRPMETGMVFDLASLTKPVVTTSLIAILIDRHCLSLDTRVADVVPFPGKEIVTVCDLLNHSSGLPPWRPFYRNLGGITPGTCEAKEKIRTMLHNTALTCPPGEKAKYSDLGFMLLEEIIEKVAGETLDELAEKLIFSKLGMNDTFFSVQNRRARKTESFAATTSSRFFNGYNAGVVSDENCYAMGGVSGHAGLFSTCNDMSLFVSEILSSLSGVSKVLPPELMRKFTRKFSTISSWGLGWDTPSENSSSGDFFPPEHSFGHLGFTGVSLWVNSKKQLGVVLLTNRVHPTTKNTAIREFRPYLHNIIMKKCHIF